ncbi:MAG: hypothetical protein IJ830_00195 [Alphaproteobacteria bacterium]|nr:hypothetical protein [Alphaproteobacteria bacterium]
MKLLIKDRMVYTIKNGKLEQLGAALELERISDDIFKAHDTYVIKGNKISVLSKDSSPIRISPDNTIDPRIDMPEQIKALKSAIKNDVDLYTQVYDVYFAMLGKYSQQEFRKLQTEAIVMTRNSDSRLFVKNEKGHYIRAKDVIDLGFDDYPSFIWHGALYVRNLLSRYEKLPFQPLVNTKRYMLFWAGGDNLFALKQTRKGARIIKLGALQQFFKTPHGVVIEVETEYGNKYKLFNLGKNLEPIFERNYDEDFDLDPVTGGLTHFKTGFSSGYKVGFTDYYVFKKGRYTKVDLR